MESIVVRPTKYSAITSKSAAAMELIVSATILLEYLCCKHCDAICVDKILAVAKKLTEPPI